MKKYLSIILIVSCTVGLLTSCDKKLELVAPTTSPTGLAYIKIAQFSPNFRGVVNNRDSFNVYANNVKINGTFLTFGAIYPTVSNLYAAVPAGAQAIRITLNGVNTGDSLTLATFNKTLTAGAYYSFIVTDSLLNTADSKQIFVQDNFARTDTLHYTIRLVHAILNDSAGKNIDVYSSRLKANMFSNVAPGTVSAFVSEPYTLATDTLIVRRAGGSFELARLNTVVFARERAFTVVYKGIPNLTTGTKARSVVTYVNQ